MRHGRTRLWGLALAAAPGLAAAAQAGDITDELVAVKAITASSVLAAKDDRYAPLRVIDGDHETAWCEGVADEGVGQSWTVTFESPTLVDQVELEPGMRKSKKEFAASNLPTRLEVKVDGANPVVVGSTNWARPKAKLPAGTRTSQLTVTFVEVEKRAVNDTCLANVSLRGGGTSLMLVTGVPGRAFKELQPTVRELSRALKVCDPAVLARRVRFPLRYEQGQEGEAPSLEYRFRDVAALVKGCKKERAPGGATADEIVQKTEVRELLGRRRRLNEVVVDPFIGWDIGQSWHLDWSADHGWQLTSVDL